MSNKLKVAITGVGHMGRYHVNVLSQIKTVDFTGIFDKDKKLAKAISKEYKVKHFDNFSDLLDNTDALIIAVPTSLHFSVAKEAINLNKHVLVEKPLCNNLSDARKLIKLAQKKKVKLFIGHVERYNAAVQELNKIVKSSSLICWESKRISTYTRRAFDIGVGLDLLIHDVDIALRIIKSPVKKIQSIGRKVYTKFEDILNVQMLFENGCVARFLVSRAHHQKERSLKITLKNSDIVLNFVTQDINIYRDAETNITTKPESIMYKQQSSVERVFIHKENPLKLEILDFIDSINKNKEMDYNNDLTTLETVFEIIKQI